MSKDRGFRARALGEIAIRCADMSAMVAFYETVIGLERLYGDHNSAIVFFRIAEGFGGHTQVLALFHHVAAPRPGLHPIGADRPVTGGGSALHHIALSLPFEEQDAVLRWYDEIGQPYRIEEFGWIGWRGIFTEDPEGNTVELVAYDPSLLT
ncbi:VOC family protein [Ruegeria sp. EL01]|jgi:catechol 2,3-dioxygenase-like lactoylglutathione lyase family enzyme|uniref:VOC family protein n=1 Tax=Ruegeria sp. EL01 TaxID=2107578 RepID=UPI000EA8013C|nr:VOC family protein [Ruegeria sp. EL01]